MSIEDFIINVYCMVEPKLSDAEGYYDRTCWRVFRIE